jgi:hypothetical protein
LEAKAPSLTEKPTLVKQLADAIRDIKIAYLSKIADSDEAASEIFWQEMTSEYPDHLHLYVAKLKYLDAHPKRMERLKDVVLAAKAVVCLISEESLAQGLGRNVDLEKPNSVEVSFSRFLSKYLYSLTRNLFTLQDNRLLIEQRDFLVEALARLALALSDSTVGGSSDVSNIASFDDTLRQLKSWVDFESSPKLSTLRIENEMRAGRYGLALKHINKSLEDEATMKDTAIRPMTRSQLLSKRLFVFEKLGLDVLLENGLRMQAISCPKIYTSF